MGCSCISRATHLRAVVVEPAGQRPDERKAARRGQPGLLPLLLVALRRPVPRRLPGARFEVV